MNVLRYLPRFRHARRELATLEARERWSRTEIETFQLQRLNEIWRQAIAHVPFYRDLAQREELPRRFTSLAEYQGCVPVLPKETVRDQPTLFLSEQKAHGQWRTTSGSTGMKTRVFWPHRAHHEMLRAKYRFQSDWGLDMLDRTVYLWGQGVALSGIHGLIKRQEQKVRDRLRNRLRLLAWRLGEDDLRDYLKRIASFRPAAIYSYTTAAYLLSAEAKASDFQCDSLKLVILSSEPIYSHVVEAVESTFGVPAISEYGSVDCGFIAGEDHDRKLRVREDMVFLETAPRGDGRYDILVSVLTNSTFPLLRYALGDATARPLDYPENGFACLHNVAGRTNDIIVTASGRVLHPHSFLGLFDAVNHLRCWRLHQSSEGAVRAILQPCSGQTRLDTGALRQQLAERLEGYPVEIEVIDRLPVEGNGKHRFISSDLKPDIPLQEHERSLAGVSD